MVFQSDTETVTARIQAVELLNNIVSNKDYCQPLAKNDASNIIRQLLSALMTAENNLNSSNHVTQNLPIHNNINATEYFSTDGNLSTDDSPMSTDSESCDSDSEPDLDYQEELISRMQYYGQFENLIVTPDDRLGSPLPKRNSTPIRSNPRNSGRPKSRSEPLASSTMMDDLLIEAQTERSGEPESFVVWSIENTDSASLKENYNRYFGFENSAISESTGNGQNTNSLMYSYSDISNVLNPNDSFTSHADITSSDFLNRNCRLPRTSTCIDLGAEISTNKKDMKTSKRKRPISKLRFMIRSFTKSLMKRTAK